MKNKINLAVVAVVLMISCSSCFVKVGAGHRRDRVNADPLRNEMQSVSAMSSIRQHGPVIPINKQSNCETESSD